MRTCGAPCASTVKRSVLPVLFQAHCAAFPAPHAVCGRTAPSIAVDFFRAIHRFDNANSVSTCAVFFAKPRNLTFGLMARLTLEHHHIPQ